jgi:ATP-dependent Clp protease ATP-binding subunit ClpA
MCVCVCVCVCCACVYLTDAYDPSYGARPIRRYLQRQVATQVAKTSTEIYQQRKTHTDVENNIFLVWARPLRLYIPIAQD